MRGVGARLCNDVNDAARCSSVLCIEAVRDDLELLHCILRDGGACAAGEIVACIGTVDVDRVGAGANAAEVQARGRNGAD